MPNPSDRYLVLSDMHFGTAESSVNNDRYRGALVKYIASKAPWEKILFTGDLLDLNLSTFTRSIEGAKQGNGSPALFGFRSFLGELAKAMDGTAPGKGLACLANTWVYLPGNHDYKIWDMLSSKVVCEDVLAKGDPMGLIPTPLQYYCWKGKDSFFAGVFPAEVRDRVTVEYSYHDMVLGQGAERVVLTHGHYLDKLETRGDELSKHLNDSMSVDDIKKNRREIFIRSAQYQTLASAVSFTKDVRTLANLLFGPGSWLNSLRRWVIEPIFPKVRGGERITDKTIRNIDAYLRFFCQLEKQPQWFVFGHTHYQDKAETGTPKIYNAGSCYPDRGMPITFLQIEGAPPTFQLMCVNDKDPANKEPVVEPSGL